MWSIRALWLASLALPLSCGDIIQGFKEPAIVTGQPSATETTDGTTGTATQIASGKEHHCALFSTGNVRCWGRNQFGQLGYGHVNSIGDDETPESAGDVAVGCTVSSLALGDNHSCALCDSGRVRCWGNAASGQLGYGNTTTIGDNETPALAGEVRIGAVATQIAAGGDHTCALTEEGAVVCWGEAGSGQLGYGSITDVGSSFVPSLIGEVNVGGTVSQVVAGESHTCALLSTGAVRCWGLGTNGALGYGNTSNVGDNTEPADVGDMPLGAQASALSASHRHTCALLTTGRIRCWGDNTTQALGFTDATTLVGATDTPAQKGSARVTGTFDRVVASWFQTCGHLTDGTGNWLCWGGTPTIPLGIAFTKVSGASENWCGIQTSGNIRCAGTNTYGQLGDGTVTSITDWPATFIAIETPAYTQSDPFFADQWHIQNTGQHAGGVAGEDANVTPVWLAGNRGDDILVSIVDDGTELTHPDLFANVETGASYNYVDGSTDPGGTTASHGTCVAGVIAARDLNGFGVRGIAPRAKIASYNMLQYPTSATIADSLIRNMSTAYISNNSWGPTDATGEFVDSTSGFKTAVDSAITSGRGGKGTSFFWASGNGAISASATATDTSNYDGYANYYGVSAVCAVGDDGTVASYSEPGANLWVCGPSEGGTGNAVYTTDLVGVYGFNSTSGSDLSDRAYTKIFNGTSAAAPMVAGVAALVYKANPNLTWRDMRVLLANTARKNDPTNIGWTTNGATPAYNISYDYGFGMVDADAAVTAAASWVNLGSMVTFSFPVAGAETVSSAIPEDGSAATSALVVAASGITKLEFVEITVGATHADWGSLQIDLVRSGGFTTSSRLSTSHTCYDDAEAPQNAINCSNSANSFRFGSARHLGESADGTWTLNIRDMKSNGTTGTFNSWRLRLFGS